MALISFLDDCGRGNSVEITKKKNLSCLSVYLLSMFSCRHRCLEFYLLGTNGFSEHEKHRDHLAVTRGQSTQHNTKPAHFVLKILK